MVPSPYILTMRPLSFSLICVLSLLPTLSIAAAPVLSTLQKPFILRAATPERWNIQLEFLEIQTRFGDLYNASIPRITHSRSKPPQFKLTNPNLTTADTPDGLTAAFYGQGGPVNLPSLPLGFADYKARIIGATGGPPVFAAKRVSTRYGRSKLQLISNQGRELRTLLFRGGKKGRGQEHWFFLFF